jgi:hypothetical protein
MKLAGNIFFFVLIYVVLHGAINRANAGIAKVFRRLLRQTQQRLSLGTAGPLEPPKPENPWSIGDRTV